MKTGPIPKLFPAESWLSPAELLAEVERITAALRELRIPPAENEAFVCGAIAMVLIQADVEFRREVKAGDGCRLDFLASSGIAIEAKAWRPNAAQVLEQVTRYAGLEEVRALIVVIEGRAIPFPRMCNGKPVRCVCLAKNHGVALP